MTNRPEHADRLRQLTRTDADPRVRHRADVLLLVAQGMPIARAARLLGTSPYRIRVWRDRFLAGGRDGLAGRPRPGRPPKLDAAARAVLVDALERGPEAFGFPVAVCPATVHRARHDLRPRQDAEAVAAAARVLDWLKRGAPAAVAGFDWPTWTSARSTPIPGWQRSGSGGGAR